MWWCSFIPIRLCNQNTNLFFIKVTKLVLYFLKETQRSQPNSYTTRSPLNSERTTTQYSATTTTFRGGLQHQQQQSMPDQSQQQTMSSYSSNRAQQAGSNLTSPTSVPQISSRSNTSYNSRPVVGPPVPADRSSVNSRNTAIFQQQQQQEEFEELEQQRYELQQQQKLQREKMQQLRDQQQQMLRLQQQQQQSSVRQGGTASTSSMGRDGSRTASMSSTPEVMRIRKQIVVNEVNHKDVSSMVFIK